ncbi:MAG: tetratricopeptide repeat protein [Polyangiales bacterium]
MTPRLALALALALAPTVARAQPALERARERFEDGQRALDEGRYADAARAFEQSLSIAHRPGTLFNLGLAYRSLGRCTEAIQSLEDFSALSHDEERVSTARAVLADLRACPATVTLSLRGAPSEVLVDGQRRPLREGQQTLRLDPGRHVIEARRQGYAPARAEVDLDRGGESSVTLDAAGSPYDGWLRLDLEGTPAVRVDGEAWSSGDTERLVPAVATGWRCATATTRSAARWRCLRGGARRWASARRRAGAW